MYMAAWLRWEKGNIELYYRVIKRILDNIIDVLYTKAQVSALQHCCRSHCSLRVMLSVLCRTYSLPHFSLFLPSDFLAFSVFSSAVLPYFTLHFRPYLSVFLLPMAKFSSQM